MKTLKKVLIIILCVLIAFLCAVLGIVIHSGMDRLNIYSSNEYYKNFTLAMEKEIKPEGITILDVQYGMNSNSVYFYENEGENIIIREYLNFEASEEQLSTVEKNASKLLVKGKKRNSFSVLSFGNNLDGYTEIWLPADFKAGFTVKTASGDIHFPVAEADDISLSSTSGDITLKQAAGKHIKASATSGNIILGQIEGNVEIDSTSGDIRLEQAKGDVRTDSTSGNVTLGRIEGTVKAESTSGDITMEQVKGAVKAESTSGDIHIMSGEGARTINTTSGEIIINKISGSFDFDTASGNIFVAEGSGCGNANSTSGDVSISLYELADNLTIETTSGEVALRLPKEASFALHFSSVSGECDTFFDEALSFNKKGTQADGVYGKDGSSKIMVSTTSGGLRIGELE